MSRSIALRVAKLSLVALFPVATAVSAQNAAVVNGKAIPSAKVDDFVAAFTAQGRPDSPELRRAVREELIARELFAQEAERRGLTKDAAVQREIETRRQDILVRALVADDLKKNPVSDAAIEAEYKRASAEGGEKEYKARHILVDSEDEAKQIVADLQKGTAFEELAKKSKDTGSAQQGGDLDWNTPSTFVKEFSDAMVKLEKGKTTEAPVKTQFGYHIIRLDDVRDVKAPPLEQVRPQIRQELERQRVQELQKQLRAKAKIE